MISSRRSEGGAVPDALALVVEVQLLRTAFEQFGAEDLLAIDVHNAVRAVAAQDGEHHAAGEVLVAAGAKEADLLQPAANLLAGMYLLGRQRQAQRPVGIADAELLDCLAVGQAVAAQVGQGVRAVSAGVRW